MLKIIRKKWWLLLVGLTLAYICALITTSCAIKSPISSTTSSDEPAVAIVYDVCYLAEDGGRIEGIDNQQVEYLGEANLVTAIPCEGYKFIGWSDGSGEAIRNDNNITTDLNITAEFRFLYAGGSGSVEDPYN